MSPIIHFITAQWQHFRELVRYGYQDYSKEYRKTFGPREEQS